MANPRSNRKKVKKQVVDAVAHIHASFNNTIVTITDPRAMLSLGQLPVVRVFVVLVRAPRSLRK